ncbi:MAG TPA: hypothetical protein VH597_15120 [Verrucomicrobiae bacterium]|jgi:hypothetical protein|nr:hypothetical protein [Verrucomicrobiae bacterium]
MPAKDDPFKAEIQRIVRQGSQILERAQVLPHEMAGEELADATAWVTHLGRLVSSVYGEKSPQFATYSKALATDAFYSLHSNWNGHFAQLVGLAKSIAHDFEHGLTPRKPSNFGTHSAPSQFGTGDPKSLKDMPEDSVKENAEIRVAKISAKQAIVVTVITAIAGLIASFASYFHGIEHSPPRHYLKIIGVEARSLVGGAVRIVADVNGQPYSYPSRAVWADLQEGQPGESFPLPNEQSEYVLRFSAFYRDQTGKVIQLTSSESSRILVANLPALDKFKLSTVYPDTYSGDNLLSIQYEVR